jgi:D-alanyl-D-alanine carboxypeptidase
MSDLNLQKTEGGDVQNISKKLFVFNGILVLLIILMLFLIYAASNNKKENSIQVDQIAHSTAFDKLELTSKSAYVFDLTENKTIFKKNEFVQLPLASITKLMTALVAIESIPKNSKIQIKKEFLRTEGDSGLLVGESWLLKDLLDFSLVVSSNDGVRSIASVVGAINLNTEDYNIGREEFIKRMNDKAKSMGLKQTYFINESGLDEGLSSGGYGSAIDVAKLMEYILINHPEVTEATKYLDISINSLDKTHEAKNTNKDIASIPGLLASKTGFTDMAGGNLVVAFDASMGQPFVVVVLGSSVEGRFNDVSKLVNATVEYIQQK